MSFQPIEVTHNTGKRVARSTRLPHPRCWCCSRASFPPYHIVVPGRHPPATLQRGQPRALSPRFHSGGGEPWGGDRGFSIWGPKGPQHTSPGEFGQKLVQRQGQLCWNVQGIFWALINEEFLTMPNLSGKLLTISNAFKVYKWQAFLKHKSSFLSLFYLLFSNSFLYLIFIRLQTEKTFPFLPLALEYTSFWDFRTDLAFCDFPRFNLFCMSHMKEEEGKLSQRQHKHRNLFYRVVAI